MKRKLGVMGWNEHRYPRLGTGLLLILHSRHVAWISCLLFPSPVCGRSGSCLCLKAKWPRILLCLAFKMEERMFSCSQRALKSSHGEYSVTSSWWLACNLFANKPLQDLGVKMLKMAKSAGTTFLYLTGLFHFPALCRT